MIEVEIPEMIIWCQIDVQQMKRVFENLINNSVKHNKRGTMLFFSMKKEADTICISIGDNGTGIPKELAQWYLNRLWWEMNQEIAGREQVLGLR